MTAPIIVLRHSLGTGKPVGRGNCRRRAAGHSCRWHRRGCGASPSGRTGAVRAAAGSRAQSPGGLRNRPGHEQLLGSLAADRGERPSRGVGRPCYHASCGRGGGGSCLVPGTSPTDCRARASCRRDRRCCAGTIGGHRRHHQLPPPVPHIRLVATERKAQRDHELLVAMLDRLKLTAIRDQFFFSVARFPDCSKRIVPLLANLGWEHSASCPLETSMVTNMPRVSRECTPLADEFTESAPIGVKTKASGVYRCLKADRGIGELDFTGFVTTRL